MDINEDNSKEAITVNTYDELENAKKIGYATIFTSVELSQQIDKEEKMTWKGWIKLILGLALYIIIIVKFGHRYSALFLLLLIIINYIRRCFKYAGKNYYLPEYNSMTKKYTFKKGKVYLDLPRMVQL